MSAIDLTRPGVWTELFPQALKLMAQLENQVRQPLWTFGGGTVLMLRIGHRQSKDIDIFVPDPQYLGYVNPRLSDVAEQVSSDYEENAEFVKFFLAAGEIDIVVGSALTDHPFDVWSYAGRDIKFETCSEIIAKKMWNRGNQSKARDLFDLCAVADAEPQAIEKAAPFFGKYGAAFLLGLDKRADFAKTEFDAIDAIGPPRSFEHCLNQARSIIRPMIGNSG